MMRSLFSGVSGLKNHQTRMDVVGNNISNVNTTGFKSSRATFSDMISQTLNSASAPGERIGGTNPKQIGLGSSVSSIDLLFTNGSVQSTGKNTDLALSGNGLFAVSDGSQRYYTRNGSFEFDADGNYVQAGSGLRVMGWMAKNGVLSTTGEPEPLRIPAGKSMNAVKTTTGTYTNNLNAETKGYVIGNTIVKYADGSTETVTDYKPQKVSPGMSLRLSTGEIVTLDSTAAPYTYTTGDTVPAANTLYTSKVDHVEATAAGKVKLTLTVGENGPKKVNAGTTIEVDNLHSGTYKFGQPYKLRMRVQANGVTTASATGETVLTGDLYTPDGTVIPGGPHTLTVPPPKDFKYKDGEDYEFDFSISKMEADTGAKVKTVNGSVADLAAPFTVNSDSTTYTRKGNGTDTVAEIIRSETESYYFNEKKVQAVNVQSKDGVSLSGLLGVQYKADGTFYPSVVSTITVYDSQGTAHDVSVLLTKTKANTWSLSLVGGSDNVTMTEGNGSKTTVTLSKTDLVFDEKGQYVSGDADLSLSYADREGKKTAENQKVTLNLASLTQYAGSNTVSAKGDGNAAGTLESVAIDKTGVLTGTYTNGVKQTEGQVAVAQFNNASGLTKNGNSLYQESNNSGVANIKTAADLGCKITPSALEMSNVDIANEFTDMIVTQRGFQSNSKTITVSDEMLETLINMKR